ncbi:MAG: hypothetical protein ACOC9Y_03980 [Chloroflexota bacterium]
MSYYGRHQDDRQIRARPYSASMIGISIAVVILVAAVIFFGAMYLFGDDDDGQNDEVTANQSSTPTEDTDASGADPTPTDDTDNPTSTATASPTNSATATATEESTDTPEPVETEVDESEPTATEEPEPEPTSEVDESEPTEEPFTGDFGPLPGAQLPSGGAASALDLDYQLGMSLEELPASGTAYWIEWPVLSFDDVSALAERLAINGEVVEEGVGTYRVSGDRGELFISPTETIFNSAGITSEGDVPSDDEAINAAFEWLELSGFVGQNIDGGRITGRDDEVGRVVVEFRPAEPAPNLAPTPSARLTVGPGATVLEARVRWPEQLVPSDYGLKAPIDLWTAVENGHGFLEADLSGFDTSSGLTGVATMTGYSVGYTIAGSQIDEQYLVPVIMFEGTARINQTGDEIPVTVSVPAVYAESGATG